MEIQFQNHQEGGVIPVSIGGKFKGRNGASRNNKLIGVRQRPSGRWVAEIKDTTQKIRMWLGTFETAEEAARAYDEAACLLRGSNTRTNFITQVSANSPLASRIKNILSSRKGDNKNNNNDNNRNNNNNNNNKSNHNNIKQTLAISSPAYSSGISTISNNSSTTSNAEVVSVSTEKTINTQLFDDAYTPDLSSCGSELELGGKMGDSWVGGFVNGFDRFPLNQEMVELQRNGGVSTESEISEFDRMKVERQISASLYAMNGVHEYMENLNNDSNEAFWDLPPLCSLLFS